MGKKILMQDWRRPGIVWRVPVDRWRQASYPGTSAGRLRWKTWERHHLKSRNNRFIEERFDG